MERKTRFELATHSLARNCSTTEPLPQAKVNVSKLGSSLAKFTEKINILYSNFNKLKTIKLTCNKFLTDCLKAENDLSVLNIENSFNRINIDKNQ